MDNGLLGKFIIIACIFSSFGVSANNATAELGWTDMDRDCTSQHLKCIWGSSENDVFAGGWGGTIIHYDGARWSEMDNEIVDGTTVNSIWGTSGNNVFAVAQGSAGPLILHYDGHDWSTIFEIDGGHGFNDIWGSSESDIYAARSTGSIYHYNGGTWSLVDNSVINNLDTTIIAIWGNSPTDVYFVSSLVVHYNGALWSYQHAGETGNYEGVIFNDIWGTSESDIFAVGEYHGVYHYEGNKNAEGKKIWSKMEDSPNGTSIWGSSGNDVFVGTRTGEIFHYDGVLWSEVHKMGSTEIYSIWGSSNTDVFALSAYYISHYGETDTPTTTSTTTPTTPTTTTTATPSDTTTTTSCPDGRIACGGICCPSYMQGCCAGKCYDYEEEMCCETELCDVPDEPCCAGKCCKRDEICSDSKECKFSLIAWLRCPLSLIYGEDSDEVVLLRAFRDEVLSQSPVGQEIIELYSQWSPAIVKAMEEDEEFREDVKEMIDEVLPVIIGERE